MKTPRLLLIPTLFLLIFLARISLAQNKTEIKMGEKNTIHSAILNEDRPYWIYLPESYHDSYFSPKNYPILILLDGDAHFKWATGVVHFMSTGINGNEQIPEMIVVAIANTDRTRDLTPTHSTVGPDGKEAPYLKTSGGGDKFLQFIQEELLTFIDKTYRTMPFRVLAGHSLGGLLAAYAFLNKSTGFQAYIAMDPSLWWDNQVLGNKLKSSNNQKNNFKSSLYLSAAHNTPGAPDTTIFRVAQDQFFKKLKQTSDSLLRAKQQYFAEEDHGSVPLLSLYHGLLFTFDGYKMMMRPEVRNAAAIKNHYAAVSRRLGIKFLPAESNLNGLGYYYLYQVKNHQKALEFFTLNTWYYPQSANVYDSLAEAYKVMGNKEKAVAYYTKTLELNPKNENARKIIQELKKK